MSKSLGNSIEPQDIIKESGAEIIRLWVAMVDYREEVRSASRSSRASSRRTARSGTRCGICWRTCTTSIRRSIACRSSGCEEVDRYALARYARRRAAQCCDAYDELRLPDDLPARQPVRDGGSEAFYADVSKDRLYTFAAASPERRSAQTAMYLIADGLSRLLAPILPLTADELWRHLPGQREASVHLAEFPARRRGRGAARRRPRRPLGASQGRARRGQRGARSAAAGQDDRHLARRERHAARGRRDGRAARALSRRPADAVHRLAGRAGHGRGRRRSARGRGRRGPTGDKCAALLARRRRDLASTPEPKASAIAASARSRPRHESTPPSRSSFRSRRLPRRHPCAGPLRAPARARHDRLGDRRSIS